METMVTEDAFKQALEEGEPERVLAALQQGADVATEIDFGGENLTPLAYCILRGWEDLAALLLEHGAPIREDEAEAYCRALRLRKNTQGSLSMLQLLLENGLDPAIELRLPVRGGIRMTPILLRIAQHGTARHLELFCRAGADLTLTDQDGVDVLMSAFAGDGKKTDIEKINFIEQQGLQLWHTATRANNYNLYRFVNDAEGVSLLLEHGVDYNHVDADGLTPLVWAACRQNEEVAAELLRAGALVAPKEASMRERERLFRIFLGLSKPKDRVRLRLRSSRYPGYEERQLNEELLNLLFAQTLHAEERARVCNLALVAACAQKRRELIDYCLNAGADIHTHTDGVSLLGFVFAQPYSRRGKRKRKSEKELIEYLFEQGADPNCRAFGVQPVLQTAVASDALPEVVELLLAHGADKKQAIPTAVWFEDIEFLKRLLAEQPIDKDLLYKALLGRTTREFAARYGTNTREMLHKLCAEGLLELTENDTDALGIPIASMLKDTQINLPQTLENKGSAHASLKPLPEPIILPDEEYEAVKQHIASGDERGIREMLHKYPGFATAELNPQSGEDGFFNFALIWAASSAQPEICRILLESCDAVRLIDIAIEKLQDTKDSPAKTETLKMLLEYAQKQQINVEIPLLYNSWSDEHVSLFLEYGSAAVAAEHGGATFLQRVLDKGKYSLAQQLVRLGCSLDACTDNGFTCLHWACRGGNADCVRLCIEAGLDVHSTIITPQGDKVTPMSLYWENEERLKRKIRRSVNPNVETLELLLQHGISPDWTDTSGATLLMHAIRTSHSAEMVQLLLQRGADVHLRDREGNTPLMTAVLEQEDEICRLLIEAGASLEDRNNAGCTAMDFARLMQETKEPGEDEET